MSQTTDRQYDISLIAAVATNGVIGNDGEMPWHISEDLKRFKSLTLNHPVIMGRKTYESILAVLNTPLPDRFSIVLTSQEFETPDSVTLVGDIETALTTAESLLKTHYDDVEQVFVIGGGTVYEQFLPLADRMFITEVDMEPDGDTTFPQWDHEDWSIIDREQRDGYAFLEYRRFFK